VRDLLLTRQGLVFVTSAGRAQSQARIDGILLELANVGYVVSSRLSERLTRFSWEELTAFRTWSLAALSGQWGADRKHTPLFRKFPDGIPEDTSRLWWSKVLVHFLQAEDQPCLFCRRKGSTHVLDPCRHVVCAHCFDGANYSACPVCEHHVNRSSPFFLASPVRELPSEHIAFKLLDLGQDEPAEARALFLSLCARTQALSPVDRDALVTIVNEYATEVLDWVPPAIPVRENVALVLGTLFQRLSGAEVLPLAKRFITTATDVLRFIAVLSGTDGSLLRETVWRVTSHTAPPSRFWSRVASVLGASPPAPTQTTTRIPIRVARFRMAKLPRSLRRALLVLLQGMDPDCLVEDMLRHRSYWVWVGQFLHPQEYAKACPNVARAFQIVRQKAPDGTPAPHFETFNARLERAAIDKNIRSLLRLFAERPGEFARHLDHALRLAEDDATRELVVEAFVRGLPAMATPVLVTLLFHLPTRTQKAAVRVYWPKGRVAKGVSSADERAVLSAVNIASAVRALENELLQRFGSKPKYTHCVVDEQLKTVMVPFNERTASKAAVTLPRGSRIPVPEGKIVRLFLHWCQPQRGVEGAGDEANWRDTTDLDLSVGFYDDRWQFVDVCSYYQLKAVGKAGSLIAESAGDLQDAPWPDGASEFVDLHYEQGLNEGIRYAVMVVNAYTGLSFSQLERAFAGIMLRDDASGQHFDPRTVQLKFALDGENGVYLPLVLDIRQRQLHWIDVHAKGQFEMNNVETSKTAIAKICPEFMMYFESGVRANLFSLGLLHAAARCERVTLRGPTTRQFVRKSGESPVEFHARLLGQVADEERFADFTADASPALALLYKGDIELPKGSAVYVLFREQVTPTLSASDFLT